MYGPLGALPFGQIHLRKPWAVELPLIHPTDKIDFQNNNNNINNNNNNDINNNINNNNNNNNNNYINDNIHTHTQPLTRGNW